MLARGGGAGDLGGVEVWHLVPPGSYWTALPAGNSLPGVCFQGRALGRPEGSIPLAWGQARRRVTPGHAVGPLISRGRRLDDNRGPSRHVGAGRFRPRRNCLRAAAAGRAARTRWWVGQSPQCSRICDDLISTRFNEA